MLGKPLTFVIVYCDKQKQMNLFLVSGVKSGSATSLEIERIVTVR